MQTVAQDLGGGALEVDVKNYAKVEKIPGGTIEECKVRLWYIINSDWVPRGGESVGGGELGAGESEILRHGS